jgi:molybdopterin-guanine dinucleotide biosynthesis protein A
MGRDKATIEIDGIPLIRRIYDAVSPCRSAPSEVSLADSVYVVTPWAQRYQTLLPSNCHFIDERDPDRGPLVGFSQGLAQITSTWILLLACDLPNLSTPTIQSWIDRLDRLPPDLLAYLPKYGENGWEPLCGFYRRSCLESLRAYVNGGGQSFQGWLDTCPVTELTISDPQILANCNTPADLADIVKSK